MAPWIGKRQVFRMEQNSRIFPGSGRPMPAMFSLSLIALAICGLYTASGHTIQLNVTAISGPPETDNTVLYYGKDPLLVGNDGTADQGGFHAYSLRKLDSGSTADV